MSRSPTARATGRAASPWGRLLLGIVGGYAATTLLLAAFTSFAGPAVGEWVNWAIILAPIVAVLFFIYAFAERSLARAAKVVTAIALVSGTVLTVLKLVS